MFWVGKFHMHKIFLISLHSNTPFIVFLRMQEFNLKISFIYPAERCIRCGNSLYFTTNQWRTRDEQQWWTRDKHQWSFYSISCLFNLPLIVLSYQFILEKTSFSRVLKDLTKISVFSIRTRKTVSLAITSINVGLALNIE